MIFYGVDKFFNKSKKRLGRLKNINESSFVYLPFFVFGILVFTFFFSHVFPNIRPDLCDPTVYTANREVTEFDETKSSMSIPYVDAWPLEIRNGNVLIFAFRRPIAGVQLFRRK